MGFRHLGTGLCRGQDWQGVSSSWPKVKGRKSLQDCANSCAGKSGCTAFDVSQPEKKKFECVLYGHSHPEPASGVPGDCYQVVKGTSSKKNNKKKSSEGSKKSLGKKASKKDDDDNPLEGMLIL